MLAGIVRGEKDYEMLDFDNPKRRRRIRIRIRVA
jgi:hypothetical protein